MKVLVCGAGVIGSYLARMPRGAGRPSSAICKKDFQMGQRTEKAVRS